MSSDKVELSKSLTEEIKDLPKVWVYRVSLNSDKGGIICKDFNEVIDVIKNDFWEEDGYMDKHDCSEEYFFQVTRYQMYLHEFEELGEFGGW